jgi:putative DNA primase/helicase
VFGASTNPRLISRWFSNPLTNVGVATGKGLLVVDIDLHKDGEVSIRRLEARFGPFPETVEVVTGSGGRHLWFAVPHHIPLPNTAGLLGSGIDTRSDNGYVVCPPSNHHSGRAYSWSVDSADVTAPAPDWLVAALEAHAREREANRLAFTQHPITQEDEDDLVEAMARSRFLAEIWMGKRLYPDRSSRHLAATSALIRAGIGDASVIQRMLILVDQHLGLDVSKAERIDYIGLTVAKALSGREARP